MIPYGRQSISDEDIDAVVRVLKSDFLTQGPAVPSFESALQSNCGAKFAVAVNSATSALHIALLALDVGPGDLVWTSPITFVASSNAARYCGADVDFIDIDASTANLSLSVLAKMFDEAERAGRMPKVLIAVHLAGVSCEMRAISELAKRYGCRIVEDASHAIGAVYDGSPVGSCRYSDITVFSFHPVKVVTTGEGGAALTNDADLDASLRLLRSHGITRDPEHWTTGESGPWHYEQIVLGYNYRMTDLQAALGESQLERLDHFVARRRQIASTYRTLLSNVAVSLPPADSDNESALHLFVVRLAEPQQQPPLQVVHERMRAAGIGVNLHYIPVYRHPYYRSVGLTYSPCPEAEAYYRSAISLPIYPSLEDEQIRNVVNVLARSLAP
jgi:UDP-4-amino-4,6-dideoxy-N-acetyl-beta-L-altrosamine transaminase